MKITILCSDPSHPVVPALKSWQDVTTSEGHDVAFATDKSELVSGDMLFLVSCSQLIGETIRNRFNHVLVLHAGDLPNGRGWSPHIWDIVEGSDHMTLCLIEATEPVDTGRIWFKETIALSGDELLDEINQKLFAAECNLMTRAVQECDTVVPVDQDIDTGTYRQKRSPEDSRLDPNLTIEQQFDLLRTVDNVRYPAFLDIRGSRYTLKITKEN